ncbi:MAG: exo-alpha-sialidase [Bacteroidetes bacterium]|jgi:hypothetical protein|nr:exo-alpha-sialidase [Bacteroidota bacterium]
MRFNSLLLMSFMCLSTFGQLTEITLDNEKNPNEPSVCFGSSSDSVIYAASNTSNFYVIDKQDFTVQKLRPTSPLGIYGDPVLHYTDSVLYFTHLSKTPGKKYGDWFDRIVVQRIDSLQPWKEQSYSVGYNNNKMQDKPWLSSDDWSTNKGNIYVTWTEFDKYDSDKSTDFSRIRFSRLTPDSDSFSTAITLSDTVGDCIDSDNTLEGVTTAVGPEGNIYAAWAGHDYIYFDKSEDGGITWGQDKIIAEQLNGWDMEMPNIMRANGMPFLVADQKDNILYVCWADERNGNADIWLKYSQDKGNTWSSAIQLNLDKTNTHQYFPNIALDKNSGKIYVAYYDFKSSSTNTFYSISLATYKAGGQLQNAQLTPYLSALPGKKVFFGDYLDMDIANNQLTIAYTGYDLSQESYVQLLHEETIDDGIFSKIAITNTVAVVRNNDTARVVMNIQHPYTGKVKIQTVSSGKKQNFVFTSEYDGTKTNWDNALGSFLLDEKTAISKIKYRIRDTEVSNLYKRLVKLN